MIQVTGRTLVIPLSERQIGTTYDDNAEVRQFSIRRDAYGSDLSHLTYRLDLEYPGKKKASDTCLLEKAISEDEIILTWQIPRAAVAVAGTVWVSIRGIDERQTIRWGSNKGAFYVEDNLDISGNLPPGLTELKQLEAIMEQTVKMSEAVKQAAEQAIERADHATEQANEAVKQAGEVLEEATGKVAEAGENAELSEAWAHGHADHPESDMNNSRYWSELSKEGAQRAKDAADQAEQLAGILIPEFALDLETSELCVRNGLGIEFVVEDATLYWKMTGSIAGENRKTEGRCM